MLGRKYREEQTERHYFVLLVYMKIEDILNKEQRGDDRWYTDAGLLRGEATM